MPTTRRAERREVTLNEIKALAWQQMTDGGLPNLSLREISRSMRMSSAAIFRYFDNREALIIALRADAEEMLHESLAEPEGASVAGQVIGLGLAYRSWALEHPMEYSLIYGEPASAIRPKPNSVSGGLESLVHILGAAWQKGALTIPESYIQMPPALRERLKREIRERELAVPPALLLVGLAIWSRLHGLVGLEMAGQMNLAAGSEEAVFELELQQLCTQLGIR